MKSLMIKTLVGTAAVGAAMLMPPAASAAELSRPAPATAKVAPSGGQLRLVQPPSRPNHVPPVIGSPCPEGTHLSPFDQPIYDEAGLFVVGYETVWYCLPDNREPAG